MAALLATWLFLLAGGCAGGMWNVSQSDAELPLEEASHPYPTAVTSNAHVVQAQISDDEPTAPAEPKAAHKPFQVTQPVTPLAAIPPAYRTSLQPTPATAETAPEPSPEPQTVQAKPSDSAPTEPPASEPPPPASTSVPQPQAPSASGQDLASGVKGASAVEQPPAPVVAATPIAIGPAAIGNTPPAPATETSEASWQRIIASLEAEIESRRGASAADPELPALEQQLRLAYLAAGRMDDAVRGVESLDPPQREAYKHLMFGLGVWLSPDEARRPPLRSAKVLRSLRDATGELASSSKLELKNLVFCDRVDYYGWFNEISRYEFKPKQAVILYVEIDNFAAEKKGNGYETELAGSYQIYDAAGRIVAERQLPLDREVCRNYRRDYFLAYTIYMPDSVADGAYRLELSIEDRKAGGVYEGRKLGEGMIEFTIRR